MFIPDLRAVEPSTGHVYRLYCVLTFVPPTYRPDVALCNAPALSPVDPLGGCLIFFARLYYPASDGIFDVCHAAELSFVLDRYSTYWHLGSEK